MKKIFKNLTLSSITTYFFMLSIKIANASALTDAQKAASDSADAGGLAKDQELSDVIGTIINSAIGLLGSIFMLLIVYSGFLWMTAQGNEEQIGKAKKILQNSSIGLLIVILSFLISLFIINVIIKAENPNV